MMIVICIYSMTNIKCLNCSMNFVMESPQRLMKTTPERRYFHHQKPQKLNARTPWLLGNTLNQLDYTIYNYLKFLISQLVTFPLNWTKKLF